MPSPPLPLRCLGALAVALAAAAVHAADKAEGGGSPARFSAEVAVGVEYDSNVSIEEIDRNTSQSDYALTLDAGVEVEKEFSDTLEGSLSYDFGQTLYDEFSVVDRQTHIFGADLTADLGKADTGLSFYYIDARLDGDPFLELYRVSPSVSGFLSRKWFARGAYVYLDKTIEDRPQRDAETHAGEADLYFFRRGLRSYFNLGYRYKDEDARADFLDYQSHGVKLRYVHRLELFGKTAKLELAWRYEERDYSGITPGIGESRDDEGDRGQPDFELPVTEKGAIQLYGGYPDYSSNYQPADYDQIVVGTRFIYRW